MGDSRRHAALGDLIAERFAPEVRIVDVAGGKGLLQAYLRRRGFQHVTSWDRRHKYANGNRARCYRYGLFDYRSAPRDYDLAVGMHPDGGTDHVIQYAVKHRVPFIVCPCCVVPSAASYDGARDYEPWVRHLISLAEGGRMRVEAVDLSIHGRALTLVGQPLEREVRG